MSTNERQERTFRDRNGQVIGLGDAVMRSVNGSGALPYLGDGREVFRVVDFDGARIRVTHADYPGQVFTARPGKVSVVQL